MVNLETTNWLIAVIAIGSAVQTLVLIAVLVGAYRLYNQTSRRMAELEERHLMPLRMRVDGILAEVEKVTTRVSHKTARVDEAINDTIDRVDETAERVKHSVREKVSSAAGLVRGVRAIITSLLTTEPTSKPPAAADGRA